MEKHKVTKTTYNNIIERKFKANIVDEYQRQFFKTIMPTTMYAKIKNKMIEYKAIKCAVTERSNLLSEKTLCVH